MTQELCVGNGCDQLLLEWGCIDCNKLYRLGTCLLRLELEVNFGPSSWCELYVRGDTEEILFQTGNNAASKGYTGSAFVDDLWGLSASASSRLISE